MIASAWWLWLSIGLFVGAALGILVAALMAAAANADRTSEKIYDALQRSERRRGNGKPDSPAGGDEGTSSR